MSVGAEAEGESAQVGSRPDERQNRQTNRSHRLIVEECGNEASAGSARWFALPHGPGLHGSIKDGGMTGGIRRSMRPLIGEVKRAEF